MNSIAPAPGVVAPEIFSQLGHITRLLHDSLEQLGVMPRLQSAAQGLPDARSRLEYIAAKTGQAADKVLTLVEEAKAERSTLAAVLGGLAAGRCTQCADAAAATPIRDAELHLQRIDAKLTEIMLAQDFHDLTGQVVRKVVALASELEDSLIKLLIQATSCAPAAAAGSATLDGPVVEPHGRSDVASNQSEVDDLLASLGF